MANPRHGFYLILRPEDRFAGAPDPEKWIDPLMRHQGTDYRISLLRAAAFHGSTHQAAMVFQIVVPRQLRNFELGRHRLQFLYQAAESFAMVPLDPAVVPLVAALDKGHEKNSTWKLMINETVEMAE